MANSVTKAVQLIYSMDNDELNQVADAIKLRRQYITKQNIRSVNIGETVSFKDSKRAQTVTGTVRNIGRKYITVQVVHSPVQWTNWRVPASMVEKV